MCICARGSFLFIGSLPNILRPAWIICLRKSCSAGEINPKLQCAQLTAASKELNEETEFASLNLKNQEKSKIILLGW